MKIPTVKEIEEYAFEKGYQVDAQKIFEYYNDNNWIDSNGKKVKNWKLKILGVWFKPENKVKSFSIPRIVLKYRDNLNQINDSFRDERLTSEEKNTLYLWWKKRTAKHRMAADGKPIFTFLYTNASPEQLKEIEYLKNLKHG